MCTHPLTITRNYPSIGIRQYVVPCGKCAECRSKKQSEFAALAITEALKSGQMFFLTLTYREDTLPIAISEDTLECVPRLVGFRRGVLPQMRDSSKYFNNCVVKEDGKFLAASLCREDVKLVLKHFRQLEKSCGRSLESFKYAVFGEYGDRHGRPHYHGLFYGLSYSQMLRLKSLWTARFGDVCVVPDSSRSLELDEFKAVSKYVSKYISKGVSAKWTHFLPFVEKPRRQSSLGFGVPSVSELASLRHFYDGCDIGLSGDDKLNQIVLRRSSYNLLGECFPIPKILKEKLFYDESSIDERLSELREAHSGRRVFKKDLAPSPLKKSAVSCLVDKFTRSRINQGLDRELRKDSSENLEQINRKIVRQFLCNEKASLQSREEIAEQNNLKSLKQQKYG